MDRGGKDARGWMLIMIVVWALTTISSPTRANRGTSRAYWFYLLIDRVMEYIPMRINIRLLWNKYYQKHWSDGKVMIVYIVSQLLLIFVIWYIRMLININN